MSILVDASALLMMAGDPRPLPGWARQSPDEEMYLSIVSADELLRGAEGAERGARNRRLAFAEGILRQLAVVPVDEAVMRIHARLLSGAAGRLCAPGAVSWVAATALAHGCRVLTPHPELYSRFPGVEIERWPPDGFAWN